MKKETKNMIRNGIFFVIIIVLTYIVIFSKMDFRAINKALLNSNLVFVLIAFIIATNNITFEAINLKRNFKLLGDKVKFIRCLKYSTIGFFFSSITPAATGGQPMQLFAMTKDKIKLSHGASALFASYICYMISTIIMAIIGFIINYEYINEIAFFKYLIYIGIIANMLILAAVMIAMFARKLAHKALNGIIAVIGKFSTKTAEEAKEKWSAQLDEYHKSSRFIVSNKRAFLRTFIISFLQVISIHSVSYFVFWALGFHNYAYLEILMLQSVIYISVSAIPLPGTVGVSETGFAIMFKRLFPAEIVEISMVLSRVASFYLLVLITGIVLSIISFKKKRRK